jgi:16S rRNA (guanine1207-N2)-methyltransferase
MVGRTPPDEAVYGSPPVELTAAAADAVQLSPLIHDAVAIESMPKASLDRLVIVAPPGTMERRFVLAHGLRVLRPGGHLVALAPKAKGGARLAKELEAFGCFVNETARRHHRICACQKPARPTGLDDAITQGGPQIAPRLGLWSQPGVFSWDRLDPGSALLLETAPVFSGRGVDLGCGVGVLGAMVLKSPAVSDLAMIDIDSRAIAAARANISDPRARFLHRDIRDGAADLAELDFVIMNPPFHQGGREDRGLGHAFIAAAWAMLRKGGVCRLVANVALPYEARLTGDFAKVARLAQSGGYRVYEAVK